MNEEKVSPVSTQSPAVSSQIPTGQSPEKKKHGCFFWGCLTVIILGLLVGGAISLVVYLMHKKALSFTSDRPVEIPAYQASEEKIQEVKSRVDAFLQAIKEEKGNQLVLTSEDINTLIVSHPDMKELAGKVYVQIEGEEIKAEGSIPLDKIPTLRGRYLNGTFGLKISLENGILLVTAETVEVRGEPLPEDFMKELRKVNLAKDVYEDKETVELLRKFKSIRIEDGKLIIIAEPEATRDTFPQPEME